MVRLLVSVEYICYFIRKGYLFVRGAYRPWFCATMIGDISVAHYYHNLIDT